MFNKFRKVSVLVAIISVFAFPNFVNAGNGADVTFDVLPGVHPKILPMNGQLPIRLGLTIRLGEFSSFCGSSTTSSFIWSVYHDVTNGIDIQIGSEKTVSFNRDQAVINRTIDDTVTVQDNGQGRSDDFIYKLYAWIECPNGTNVTASAPVDVKAGSGAAIFTCVVPTGGNSFAYSCSPNNTNNCSDNPQCTGKPCFQVRVSLCGDPAPPSSSGPGTPAVCGNNTCESGETQSNCPADCEPGQDQPFSFSIPNPLKGGATDLAGLVAVLAQWLFNLAIPIATVMIVYAGVLFLTAQGNPQQVTKAKDVLKWAVVGLAIILIGSGFVTLIQSILDLGGTSAPTGPGLPVQP